MVNYSKFNKKIGLVITIFIFPTKMLFAFFFVSVFSFQPPSARKFENTFCICKGNETYCSRMCRDFHRINTFSGKKIYEAINDIDPSEVIYFLVAGSTFDDTENMPIFNLTRFQHRSFVVEPASPLDRESIILYPGHLDADLSHTFRNLNIYLDDKGTYDFYYLKLRNCEFYCTDSDDIDFEQDIIDTDFESIYGMPIHIFRSPTLGATIVLNRTVSDIEFWDDYTLVFKSTNPQTKNKTEASFSFSQIRSRIGNSTIKLSSPKINMTFHSYPDNEEFFPKLTFEMRRTSSIYFDFPIDGDFHESMNLEDRITFKHSTYGLYIYSREGTLAPTFKHEGTGPFLRNDKPVVYHDTYCLCNNETLGKAKCEEKCGSTPFVPFSEIEYTVIGNYKDSLKYIIAGSDDTNKNEDNVKVVKSMPVFDIEHFKDKNLTVYGMTKNEHIRIIGDTTDDPTDDVGYHRFSSITIHTIDSFSFPDVTLYNIVFAFDESGAQKANKTANEIANLGFLNTTHLEIDYTSLKQVQSKKIPIIAPLYGFEVHTTNILKGDFPLKIINKTTVQVAEVIIPIRSHTLFELYCGGSLSIQLDPTFPNTVNDFPKTKIVLEGDENSINFIGKWDEHLSTLTSKIIAYHGDNPLYSYGDFDGTKSKFNPPAIAHDGTGAYYVNGLLTNYHSCYCICEGTLCEDYCKKYAEDAPIVNFSESSISATAIGNPTRMIEYVIVGSGEAFGRRPFFGLHDYQYRSFMITNGDSETKQYISIEGALDDPDAISSVSHIFRNINIMLANPGYYTFNNLELYNCDFEKYTPSSTGSSSAKLLDSKTFHLRQYGMRADLYSLRSLQDNKLLSPCSLYLTVDGDHDLTMISIEDTNIVKLHSNSAHDDDDDKNGKNTKSDEPITIDSSHLIDNGPTYISHVGNSYDNPLIVRWNARDSIFHHDDIPLMNIDVSGTDGDEAFIQFDGRSWTDKFHNLTSRITVIHGLLDIHIMTPVKDLQEHHFSGQPPHVNLVGDADYYINDIKQISIFSPGNHNLDGDNDEIDTRSRTKTTMIIFGLIIAGFVIALIVFLKTPKGDNDMPKMRIVPQHDTQEDDQLASYLNVDDDDSNAQFKSAN